MYFISTFAARISSPNCATFFEIALDWSEAGLKHLDSALLQRFDSRVKI
jgi:hypothetical protein